MNRSLKGESPIISLDIKGQIAKIIDLPSNSDQLNDEDLYKIKKSNSMLTSVSLMISPLVRQSFLLSSSTVFMFSIHTASTGPSNRYHFLSLVVLELPTRIMEDKIPSVLDIQEESNR